MSDHNLFGLIEIGKIVLDNARKVFFPLLSQILTKKGGTKNLSYLYHEKVVSKYLVFK